jgi:uncharacterized repeat protein (TIGR01451 family)
MKKNYAAQIICALFFICATNNLKAQYVNIPDANFRTWLMNNGYSGCMVGNTLDTTCSAVLNATTINCSAQSISDLTGIQYFSNLSDLNCSYNPVPSLPALPSSLLTLDCSTDLLTVLPELPASLIILNCYNNQLANLPVLPSSLTYLDCNTNLLTTLPALPLQLDTLACGHNQLTSLPALPNSLVDLVCKENQITSLPLLPNSLERLDCYTNLLSSLPILPNLLHFLDCFDNQLTVLPTLPASLFSLTCQVNLLTSLPALPNSLYHFNCSSNQLTTLPALPNFLGHLLCDDNQLSSLPALPNSITWMSCINNQLATLPSLPSSLDQLECYVNQLTTLPALPASLHILYCEYNLLSTLPNLPAHLNILDCSYNQITSLPEFPDSINFDCRNNPNLFCLPQLKKMNALFFDNTGITCLPNYGSVIYSSPLLSSIPLCGIFNPNGCAAFWNISGKSYYDSNGNCLFDSADAGQANSHIMLYENNVLQQQVFSGGEGYYSFQVPNAGNYSTEIDTSFLPFDVFCPASLNYNDTITLSDTLSYNNDFAMVCKPGFDVGVLSIQACVFRPVHQTQINIHAGDISNFYGAHCAAGVSGSVVITLSGPASYVAPAVGALTPDIVSGDSLVYNIADFGSLHFNTDFNIIVVTDTFAVIGSQVCVNVSVLPIAGDNNVNNNKLSHCFTVVSSYDPNDKQVDPITYIDLYGDRWLTYTINFQNTGTTEAEHIYVTDTLDSNLDLSSFQLVAYSHHVIAQISAGGIAKFNFPNINLPDSNTDEPASHGYVQYRIQLKDNATVGTQVSNTAYIYFDFNSPVVTNTTLNTVTNSVGITSINNDLQISVFPNPTRDEFTVYCPQFTVGKKINLTLTDILGKELLFQTMRSANCQLPIAGFPSGIYFLRIETEDGITVKKLVKE